MADFAKAQLMKYGWTEGKGLGKNEHGITEALKPKLKFDTAGVGHKDTDWNEWWETAFNRAASSIKIESKCKGVSISVSKESLDESVKEELKKKVSGYGNFLKTSTLQDGKVIEENAIDKAKTKKIENDIIYTPLTDEELFKACGGRTAHKGARHGLTLNGKLERIAEQERKMLNVLSSTSRSELNKFRKPDPESQEDEHEMDSNANTILPLTISSTDETDTFKVSKSRRKQHKRRVNNLTHQLNVLCNLDDTDKGVEVKTKKRHRSKKNLNFDKTEPDLIQEIDNGIYDIPLPTGTNRTHVEGISDTHSEKELELTSIRGNQKKKSKRKRSKSCQEKSTFAAKIEEEEIQAPSIKKSKMFLRDENDIQNGKKDPRISSDECTKKEANRLNARIKKKKEAKHKKTIKTLVEKMEKKKLETIVVDMMAFNISENKNEPMKKLSKKNKKSNK